MRTKMLPVSQNYINARGLYKKKYPRNYFASYKMPVVKSRSRNTYNAFKLKNRGMAKSAATKIQSLFRGRRLRNFLFKK